jgi:hypothetical protein
MVALSKQVEQEKKLQIADCRLQIASLLFAFWFPANLAIAQEPKKVTDDARAFIAAATSISSREMPTSAGILLVAQRQALWDAVADTGPAKTSSSSKVALDLELLAGIEDKAPVRDASQNYYEFQSYNYVLVHAHKIAPAELAKNSRRDLTFAHLFEESQKYRGQLIHVEGRLKRLRKFDANRAAAKEGVPTIYEGWIFGDHSYGNPYCVIVSELPSDISPGEEFEERVAFDGYFFKRYRYKAGDGWRDAPLLIGRTLSKATSRQPSEPEEGSFFGPLLPAFLGVIAGTFALGLALTIWYRRGDRRVQDRLNSKRAELFFESYDDEV